MATDSRSSLVVILLGLLSVLFPALTRGDSAGDASLALSAAAAAVAGDGGAPASQIANGDESFCDDRMMQPLLDFYRVRDSAERVARPPLVMRPDGGKDASSDASSDAASGAPADAAVGEPALPATVHEVLRYFRDAHREGRAPHVLIATVPDPIDSALAYDFDRNVEALQLALESGGRVRDRAWLPWSSDAETDADPVVAARVRACRHRVPGVVVFRERADHEPDGGARQGRDAQPIAVLLIVGEAPTWGVHKSALRSALDFAALVAHVGSRDPGERTIRIVGPTFSGSAESLRYTLRVWASSRDAGDVPAIRIVSGSVTGLAAKKTLEGADGTLPRVEFRATTIPDDALSCAFYAYLHDKLRVDADDKKTLANVALLHESGTTYGATFASAPESGAPPPPCYGPERTFGFPPHIASIRSAYAAVDRHATPSDPSLPPPTRLDPTTDEPAEPRDVVPMLSPRTTFAHDALLTNLLQEIAQKEVRYLGLVGTDPADLVFLASQIKKVAPDVRLFTFGSEVLYLHPAYENDLLGMLVATPYPFFGASDPRGLAVPFSGGTPEGTYNAAVALVGGRPLAEYGRPGGPQLPAWIAVVSKNGLVPLDMQGYDDKAGFVYTPPERGAPSATESRDATPPRFWQLAVFFLSVFALYNVAGYVRYGLVQSLRAPRRPTDAPIEPISPLFRVFHRMQPCIGSFERVKQSYYVVTALGSMLVAEATLVLVHIDERRAKSASVALGVGQIALLLIGTCFAAAILAAIVAAVRFYRYPGAADRRTGLVDCVLRLLVAVTVTLVTLVGIVKMHADVVGARATNLTSGVSPTTPALLVAACMYVWSLAHLTRVHLLDAFHARAPETSLVATSRSTDDDPVSVSAKPSGFRADLDALTEMLLRTLQSPLSSSAYWMGSMALVGAAAFVFVTKAPLVFEGDSGRRVLVGGFAALVLATGTGLVWMLLFWSRMHALLLRFSQHPILFAFARLPKPFARSVEDQISSSGSDVTDLVIPVRQVVALDERIDFVIAAWNANGSEAEREALRLLGDFHESVAGVDATLERELAVHTGGRGSRDLASSETMQQLVAARTTLFALLELLWGRRLPRKDRQALKEEDAIATLSTRRSLSLYRATLSKPALAWLCLAEEFVATQLTFDISHLLRHFRHFLLVVTVGGLTMLMTVSSYAVQPRRLLMTFIWIVILSVAGAGLWIYVQMDRDGLLSRIARTQPGKVTLDRALLARVFTWVVLPILGVVMAQYPDVARQFFTWATPFTKALG